MRRDDDWIYEDWANAFDAVCQKINTLQGSEVTKDMLVRIIKALTEERKNATELFQAMRYSDYLNTHHWKHKRAEAVRGADARCQLCNSQDGLNVHHRTYETLGKEARNDLTVLCSACHELFHQNRKAEGQRSELLPIREVVEFK